MSGLVAPPSRSTFRETATHVAWQKQLRDRYTAEGAPPLPHLDLKRAVVRPVSRNVAAQIILKYEWLGTMATGANRYYGLFFGDHCAGVTSFAPAGFNLPALAKTFAVAGADLAYLGRGACVHWAPTGANSKLVAWSLKYETKRGGKLAVAFADTDAGEIGTIYQASNWWYIGAADQGWPQWVSVTGRTWSYNQFTKWYRDGHLEHQAAIDLLEANGWHRQTSNPKHRYVFILDRTDTALVARIAAMRRPYPKRLAA